MALVYPLLGLKIALWWFAGSGITPGKICPTAWVHRASNKNRANVKIQSKKIGVVKVLLAKFMPTTCAPLAYMCSKVIICLHVLQGRHSTPLHSTLLHSTPPHSTLLHSTSLHSTYMCSGVSSWSTCRQTEHM